MIGQTRYTDGLNNPVYSDPSLQDFEQYRQLLNYTPEEKYTFLSNVYGKTMKTDRQTSITAGAPISLANRYALFTWFGLHGQPMSNVSEHYRDVLKNSIVRPVEADRPTTSKLIEYFQEKQFGGIEYAWSDFLWTKWHNKIPNNYLLTLRRFPMPCDDNIYNVQKSVLDENSGTGADVSATVHDLTNPDIARAVTWFSESTENSLNEILNFGYGYNWKEQEAQVNSRESTDTSYTAQPFYEKMGTYGQSFFDVLKGITPGEKARRARTGGHDPLVETYENFVLGPVNVINKMMTRDIGLNFDQDIKLNFEYKLKSYAGLNPKVAMLDIFANLLVLTYSNANFWGGANRFYGGGGYIATRFGDVQKLTSGDYRGYLGSVVDELGSGFKSVFADFDTSTFSIESILAGFDKIGGAFLGNMLGGFINKQLGSAPAFQALKGFITGESTGYWHLTVGNPINPIAMFGNLILENSQLNFGGKLGRDDFPTELTLECTLKHARARDKSDFESAFNAGKGRLYAGIEGFKDVLNLRGAGDMGTYGAFSADDLNTPFDNKHGASGDDFEKLSPEAQATSDEVREQFANLNKWRERDGVLEAANSFVNL